MRLLKSRDELFDGFDRIEALRIRIGYGLAVNHLVVGIEPQLNDLEGHWTLSRQTTLSTRKKKPRMGGLRGFQTPAPASVMGGGNSPSLQFQLARAAEERFRASGEVPIPLVLVLGV
jgi:hypothetical protein